MSKFLMLAAVVAAVSIPAIAQEVPVQDPTAPTQAQAPATAPAPEIAAPAMGKIIMYRPSAIMGMGLACPIRFKGQEIVELGRGKFAEWHVPAGSYILANKTASVEVNVFPGQTKYVRCQIKPGFMTGRADLQIVDQESFAEHQADYEQKEVVAPTVVASAQ